MATREVEGADPGWVAAKRELYDTYVSGHARQRAATVDPERLGIQFRVWEHLYGRVLPRDRTARVLDVGCGSGGFLLWLQHLGFQSVHGIDISREQVEEAHRVGIECVEQADALTFLERDDRWDFIVLRDVLEHFDREQALRLMKSVRRALYDGGSVLVQVPNGAGVHAGEVVFGDLTHEMAYTRSSVEQLFRTCGLRMGACYPVNPPPIGIKGVLRSVIWNLRVGWYRFWKWIETGSREGIFTRNFIAVGYAAPASQA